MADVDPTDHARTTIPRAGEAMKDTRSMPGYFLMGLAIVALVACLAGAGMSQIAWTDRARRDRGGGRRRRVGVGFLGASPRGAGRLTHLAEFF
jgi:hypothetical protein